MIYIAISIVLAALIVKGPEVYFQWKYNRRTAIVKRGFFECNGIRYKLVN